MTDKPAAEPVALLDCPFCGGDGVIIPENGGSRPQCKSCGAGFGYFNSKRNAVEAWNTRAVAPAQAADAPSCQQNGQTANTLTESVNAAPQADARAEAFAAVRAEADAQEMRWRVPIRAAVNRAEARLALLDQPQAGGGDE